MMLELCLLYADVLLKKESCKGDSVGLDDPRGIKIIFTLLAEVVAVHMQFTIIYIQHLSFKGLFALLWRLAKFLVGLQVSLHKSFEQFIGRRQSRSWSLRDSRGMSGSIIAFGGGSWWTSCELIFTAWRRVMVRTATSAWSGHSLVKRWELLLPNGLADPLDLEFLEL